MGFGIFAVLLLAACAGVAPTKYTLDFKALDKEFDGLGAISGGGATSRLLVEYPEPQRSQILDYLFKPNFGASLHMLKVEIGGDSQSTDGTEPSHMHSRDDLDLTRGYEWWLMQEAKKRNPNIKLYGLPWAFPGWVGSDPVSGTPTGDPFAYPNQTAGYVVNWVRGARDKYGLDVDYIGVWNERSSSPKYTKALRAELQANGFGSVKIVAKDGLPTICEQMANDPEYASTIDIIGLHYPSDYVRDYSICHSLGKPIWASEESSSYDDFNGAACWGRVINSHYALHGFSSSIIWNLIGSYYHGTNWYASSLMTAVQPWSGYWENLQVLWATAHVTQFTQPGWRYLKPGNGSGELEKGGYYTTLVSPSGDDFTLVVVKISWRHAQCTRPPLPYFETHDENATFTLSDGFRGAKSLSYWRSNFELEGKMQFEKQEEVEVVNGAFSVPVKRGDLLTFTTLRTGRKGSYSSPPSRPAFPLPHVDDFNGVAIAQEAERCTDQIGSFEVVADTRLVGNKVMRQMVPQLPIGWSDHGSNGPITLLGMREWSDVSIQIEIRIPSVEAAGCVATRSDQMWKHAIVLCVEGSGEWRLMYSGPPCDGNYIGKHTVTKGKTQPLALGKWYTLNLTTVSNKAAGTLDGAALFTDLSVRDVDTGFAAFGTNSWFQVEYDNLRVEAVGSAWVPQSPCKSPVPSGTVLSAGPCQRNGLTVDDQSFSLTSDWHIVHNSTGMCVTASEHRTGASLTLQPCDYNSTLQRFTNRYTRIRDEIIPLIMDDTTLVLVGKQNGSVTLGLDTDPHDWSLWAYFPNTFQLRNQYTTNLDLGFPLCLRACP